MIEIEKSDILNILETEVGYPVKLKDGRFLTNSEQNLVSYYWTPFLELELPPTMASIGIPIVTVKKNFVEILPGLLELIQSKEIQLSANDLGLLSMGKNLSLECENGLYTIIDQFSRKISWGFCKDGTYYNLIDLGWYLRKGF